MYVKKATVINPTGLHARPAADFVKCATAYSASITVGRPGDGGINAKSIIMLLSQGLTQGTEVEIAAEGPDEKEAVEALVALLSNLNE